MGGKIPSCLVNWICQRNVYTLQANTKRIQLQNFQTVISPLEFFYFWKKIIIINKQETEMGCDTYIWLIFGESQNDEPSLFCNCTASEPAEAAKAMRSKGLDHEDWNGFLLFSEPTMRVVDRRVFGLRENGFFRLE